MNLEKAVGTRNSRKRQDNGGFNIITTTNRLGYTQKKRFIRSYQILSAFPVCYCRCWMNLCSRIRVRIDSLLRHQDRLLEVRLELNRLRQELTELRHLTTASPTRYTR